MTKFRPEGEGRTPVSGRGAFVPVMTDDELERELTLAAGARTRLRRELFDTLLTEAQRRRRYVR